MKLRINEKETPNIEVKHEGILEVPEGKNVDDLPLSHFVNLANKKGLSKITKALNNLQVWNKNDDKELSKWAGNMIDKLNKKLKKDEGVIHRAYNLDNDESRRKEIADTFGHNFTPDNHILICRDNKPLNIQVGKKYKCTACNNQRVEVVSIDDVYTDDRGDTASITVLYRGKMYAVASTQLYESHNAKDVKVSINEDLYNIIYDVDSEDGYTYTEEEMFKGSWTDLQNLIKQMKSNGCYNIDANAIYDEEDFEESVKFKEASEKSYWKYYMNDPAIERIENSEYDKFDKTNIKKVKLYSCANEEDCYEDDFSWAVCYYDCPNKAFYGNKEDAYIALMDYLNTSIYEKRNDL